MPNLLLHIVNGSWVGEVSNQGPSYTFAGSTVDMQLQNVRNLSLHMEQSDVDTLGTLFNNPGVTNATLRSQLFDTTDGLIYADTNIFPGVGAGQTLFDVVDDAGVWLDALLV